MRKPIVLVTGASGGIGHAIAETLLEAGFAVVLQYRSNVPVLSENILQSPEYDYLFVRADLTQDSDTKKMISIIHQRMGTVTALINCAGIALKQMLFEDTDDSMNEAVFRTNVFAPMRLTRLLLPDLREKEGSVINISSMWGVSGAACEVIYSASKAALIGFTKALAKEVASSHVTVNTIAPGFIETSMNDAISIEDREQFRINTPLETLGTPKDIARGVLYLLRSRFVTGQVLSIDGGINI